MKVNGYLTDKINITRGICQGYPISALLLYVLIAEVLGIVIRKNKRIPGVKISGSELMILQYVDVQKFLRPQKTLSKKYLII